MAELLFGAILRVSECTQITPVPRSVTGGVGTREVPQASPGVLSQGDPLRGIPLGGSPRVLGRFFLDS